MDRLWSPWRLPYVIGSKSEPGCVFCDALGRSGPESLVLYDGETCFVVLNLYPYNNGHLMVVPHRHTGTLSSLSEVELRDLAVLTQRAYRRFARQFAQRHAGETGSLQAQRMLQRIERLLDCGEVLRSAQ